MKNLVTHEAAYKLRALLNKSQQNELTECWWLSLTVEVAEK
jgi:hypothetical protein